MKLIFAILCLVVVSNEGLAEKCEEDKIKKCVDDLGDVIEKMNRVPKAGIDLDYLCSRVGSKTKCLKNIPESCKADFPLVSVNAQQVNLYNSEFCGENGKMYMGVAPCLKANKKCEKKEVVPEKQMCELVDYMLCTAKYSKEKCNKDGEAYGNALEARMKATVCKSGAGYLANSFWTFATTVLSVFLIRNKMQ